MSKKILIVGGVAGGASTATRVRRLDEDAEIVMYERGPHVSFSNCSLPFYLNGLVEKSEDLLAMTPEDFKKKYNITAKVNHEVMKINPDEKTIELMNLNNNDLVTKSYDTLVLSPGANPIMPNIPGIDKSHVFSVRNVPDIVGIKNYIEDNEVEEITVVGGGFIGIEVAESLCLAGYKVTLVEAQKQILSNFDYDYVQILHKEMIDKGVNLVLNDGIAQIDDEEVVLASGKEIKADTVIMAIGVSPDTTLARKAELEIGETGGIKVNTNYQTSDPDIYAVGDAIEVYNKLTEKPSRLALAFPAQMQARSAANHMYGHNDKNSGVIVSSCLRVFDYNAASTGLNEKGIYYDFSSVIRSDKVDLIPGANLMHLKVLFEKPTGRILGGQAIGKGDITKRIDVLAAMITMNATLEDLKDVELTYSPLFNTAKDPVNVAATNGLNILHGHIKHIPIYKVRELVESNATMVDVREEDFFEKGHVKNAINIPFSKLRENAYMIPTNKPIYVYCHTSHASYNSCKTLQNLGFKDVYNISGSYKGLSLYEYFNDKTTNRKPILTYYDFD